MFNFIVLAGGIGSRLWPLSSKDKPKQFQKLINNKTLVELTIDRIVDKFQPSEFIVTLVGSFHHKELIEETKQMQKYLDVGINFKTIYETIGMDTGPAILFSTLVAKDSDLVVILPSDHYMDGQELEKCIRMANDRHLSDEDCDMFVLGIKPQYPETGYGYLKPNAENGSMLDQFKEKPNLELAKELIDRGCLWNSGIFIFNPKKMIKLFEIYAFGQLTMGKLALEDSTKEDDGNTITTSTESYSCMTKISFDFMMAEKLDKIGLIHFNSSFWSDVGEWKKYFEVIDIIDKSIKDENKNHIIGENTEYVEVVDSSNSLIINDKLNIGVIDVDNVAIINEGSNLLVTSLENSHKIKSIHKNLTNNINNNPNLGDGKFHRQWGYYQCIAGGIDAGFQSKVISVNPGHRLSLQYHHHRSEHWTVVKGTAQVTIDKDIQILHKNNSIYIPKGATHRIANPYDEELVIIETQIGDYLGEDDIVRLEDDYGRT